MSTSSSLRVKSRQNSISTHRKPTDPLPLGIAFIQLCKTIKLPGRVERDTLAHHRGEWYAYVGTHWRKHSGDDLSTDLINFLHEYFHARRYVDRHGIAIPVTSYIRSNVEEVVKARVKVNDDVDMPAWRGEQDTEPPRSYLVFRNGMLPHPFRDNPRLEPHDPYWFSTVCLDYDYDRHATCPKFEAFLDRIFEGDQQRIALIQEWLGYTLVFDMSYQMFLVAIGEGANGKSVLFSVWTALLGKSNVSNVDLARFGDRFALHGTRGKLANFCSEPGPLSAAAENVIKQVVGGDDGITFEQKHRDPFDAYPTIRILVACNNIPRFTDRSMGLWRRAKFIPFNVTIPSEQQDRDLAAKIKAELPGVLNFALEGLVRLRKQGSFTRSDVCEAAAVDFRKDANSARTFLEENCRYDESRSTGCDAIYAAYVAWAVAQGWGRTNDGILNNCEFGKEITRVFPKVKHKRPTATNSKKRYYAYHGLAYGEPTDDNNTLPLEGI